MIKVEAQEENKRRAEGETRWGGKGRVAVKNKMKKENEKKA